jgi:hypothetical protein
MKIRVLLLLIGLLGADSLLGVAGKRATAADTAEKGHSGPACVQTADGFFVDEVWTNVAAESCLKCHKAGGDAEDSEFILLDPTKDPAGPAKSLMHNHDAFAKMAATRKGDQSRMLLKAVGELDHGGDDVLEKDSARYRILEDWVRRVAADYGGKQVPEVDLADADDAPPFFDGIEMIDDLRLLRRVTLSLGARLPTAAEKETVANRGLPALGPILDRLMTEDAFYERLTEGFNDIFLTQGYDGNAETALSYEHFQKTRLWYQKYDHSAAGDEKAQREAGYKLAREYREAMRREPLEMIEYIVRNGRPFTEIVTADYIMVSPYSSRGYGLFEELRDKFEDPDDYLEFIPAKLSALQSRDQRSNQESATGFYPHAGLISTFQYLKRYPTTETNRNRLRVRMIFQHFLGIDIMQLAPRGNDAAAVTAKYEVPTMEAADCAVCHKIIDPMAGLFQDYYALDGKGIFGPRKEGWFTDMFAPGLEGEDLPGEERWRSLQWLGERIAKDPRFAVAMVEHVWYILSGRKALLPPEDLEDPLFAAKRRAFGEQRREIEKIATRFSATDFDLKVAFKELAVSPFYRANGLAAAAKDPGREAELNDLGLVRMLAPEQLERKLMAVFGKDWGRLKEQFKILYGGIDSKAVTERIADPSGAMGAIQRMMSNDIACRNVALDFSLDPDSRLLFPRIEPDVLPDGDDPEAEKKIRATIVHLHDHLLGRVDAADDPEVNRSYQLFAGIIADAQAQESFDKRESYFCQDANEQRVDDPLYTIRAWRGVVTYLLRQQEFLYE